MSMAAMTELEGLLGEVAGDEGIQVLVLTGGVPGYFVAHADVEDLARIGAGQPVEGDPGSWRRAFALLETMPQPVVAAVDG
jgi:enoyl-CoA hydratase/carnithine racemase